MDNGNENRTREWDKTSSEMQQIQSKDNEHYVHAKREKENLETWRSGDGGIQRKLDYIKMKNKNWVKSTRTKGQANINQMKKGKLQK